MKGRIWQFITSPDALEARRQASVERKCFDSSCFRSPDCPDHRQRGWGFLFGVDLLIATDARSLLIRCTFRHGMRADGLCSDLRRAVKPDIPSLLGRLQRDRDVGSFLSA
jgi:hypothetical protein